MAVESGFFNSINRDRVYEASFFAQYFASFIGNGVFPNPSTGLQVVAGENLTTVVRAGKGWINGYIVLNDSDYVVQHDIADGVLKRIDRIVMGLNYEDRKIDIYLKKGVFSSNPTAPSLQRDSNYYELALADVYINNGTTQISQSNITDTRLNSDLCGIVSSVVDQVDTTTIFNQYQDFFDDFVQNKTNDFEQFVESIRSILDENVAGNLLNMINSLESGKLDKTSVGQPNGLAPLNSESKIDSNYLYPNEGAWMRISDVQVTNTVSNITFANLNLNRYRRLRLTAKRFTTALSSNNVVNVTFNNSSSGYKLSKLINNGVNTTTPVNVASITIPPSSNADYLKQNFVLEIENSNSVLFKYLSFEPTGNNTFVPAFGSFDKNFVVSIELNAGNIGSGILILEGILQ